MEQILNEKQYRNHHKVLHIFRNKKWNVGALNILVLLMANTFFHKIDVYVVDANVCQTFSKMFGNVIPKLSYNAYKT